MILVTQESVLEFTDNTITNGGVIEGQLIDTEDKGTNIDAAGALTQINGSA